MRIFFSVGEPSGDLHASNLIRRMRECDADLDVVGFGGAKMRAAGCELLYDMTELAVMFLAGAIKNLRLFFKLIAQAEDYFANHSVDAVVLIDYPGFNWWIARKAKKYNIPVFYYGVPQMWAWAPWRIKKIRKFVDHVICKLPFEPKWFLDRGCEAFYVGHPYFDQLHEQTLDQSFIRKFENLEQSLVLLLPGSRDAEIVGNLSTLLSAGEKIRCSQPNVRLVVSCLSERQATMCRAACIEKDVEIFFGRTQELMTQAKACIACSGSVSLELLYHRVPTVIVYKIGWVKSWLQNFVLKCKYITLTNLMNCDDIRRRHWGLYDPDEEGAELTLMPEYVSCSDRSEQIAARIATWLRLESARLENVEQLDVLAGRFAKPGATARAADYIISNLTRGGSKKAA